MDEEYFLYDEDLEWCERAARVGGGVAVVPSARFVHAQGATTRRNEGLPFTARMLADFQLFVESRGEPAATIRRFWWIRQTFRRFLYGADARFGVFGRRPGSPARTRIYRELARALRTMDWRPSAERQNAHPDRLPELTGCPVPGDDPAA
jgi:GT2 family glycosyltransferase